jgi:hypothetical protein
LAPRLDLMRPAVRKLLLVALPATIVATFIAMVLVELWVRVAWDERRGTPGFFLSDPVLGLRLSPGYDGWFAGTPVKINSLGFRDDREYAIAKGAGTIRVIVLGDSVTFGHGALYEATYPYLLEQHLKRWRPDIDWQVWNLGVPGLNTAQEFAYLQEVGNTYQPDLVVVGFYANDFYGNGDISSPGRLRRSAFAVQRVMQRHLYSYEFYKRTYLTLRFRLLDNEEDWKRLDHLETEERLFARTEELAQRPEQQLTEVDYFDDAAVASFTCPDSGLADSAGADQFGRLLAEADSEHAHWLRAVRAFQQLHRDGRHRIVFFSNASPDVCQSADRFVSAGTLAHDAAVLDVLSADGTPATSSAPEFLHYRPSQMPLASTHAIGNSNRVKADALFAYLRDHVMPELLAARSPGRGEH